ncbi:MAG: dephospho-CoA kinase [Firmicutes bacterium]|nr:dephospho-CoA kinase [Bacillota bacterium]
MVVIGLTGKIASGKSTVSGILKDLGAEIIDGDDIGREIVRQGSPTWKAIRREFGDGILMPDGSIDRRKLGALVFSRPEELRKLNRLTHPEIKRVVAGGIEQARSRPGGPPPVVVVDAAVLLEAGMDDLVDEVWVVTVDRETQLRRLMARDGMPREAALARIESQASVARPIRPEHVIIDNTDSPGDLARRVRSLWDSLIDRLYREERRGLEI